MEHRDNSNPTYRTKEQWKTLPDFDNYLFSSEGRVKRKMDNYIYKLDIHVSGFAVVKIKNNDQKYKQIFIHKAVGKLFVKNPHNYKKIIHIDRNRLNNRDTNLKWSKHVNKFNPIYAVHQETHEKLFFDSPAQAVRKGFKRNGISRALCGESNLYKGFYWFRNNSITN